MLRRKTGHENVFFFFFWGSNVKLLAIFRDRDWIKVRLEINVWWRRPNSAARAERSFALEDVCLRADKQTDGGRVLISISRRLQLCRLVRSKKNHTSTLVNFTRSLIYCLEASALRTLSVNLPPSCPGECLCKHNRCSSWVSHYSNVTHSCRTPPPPNAHTEKQVELWFG